MQTGRLRVADVFRAGWEEYNRTRRIGPHQRRAVRHILACRTAALGGHLYRCEGCGSELPVYNSCHSRHCPTCQTSAKEKWLTQRHTELLPVRYFHVVFTLPHELNGLVDANRQLLLGELFAVVAWVLERFAADPRWRLEGQIGAIAVLHTWTQRLQEHFHIHCIIPGGVWQPQRQRWVHCRRRWLFRKDSLTKAFRNRFLSRLAQLRLAARLQFTGTAASLSEGVRWRALIHGLAQVKWVVYPKAAAGGPDQVLDYLGRYTHRVAISDHRLLSLQAPSAGSGQDGQVTYTWRDRADGNSVKTDTITVQEFIHRFLYHVLPDGFQKIRYYGWLASAHKKTLLPAIRAALQAQAPPPSDRQPPVASIRGLSDRCCPICGQARLVKTLMRILPVRGPP
jgi:hypothetical protein